MFLQYLFLVVLCISACAISNAFVNQGTKYSRSASCLQVSKDFELPPTVLDFEDDEEDVQISYLDELEEDDDDGENSRQEDEPRQRLNNRWQALNPKLKERLIEKGQQRAIANKAKRESALDKKRRT
jgi:hypothetical protein